MIRRPSTVWFNLAHSLVEGQQASPGKQRQLVELLVLLGLRGLAVAAAVRASKLVQKVAEGMTIGR